mmetsp:Transcript_33720/g.66637  ORF Transcript_33720/g.66637 Transcript_33720/m.66637 type:complete len:144 (-) Transcript_33720:146-577(-)
MVSLESIYPDRWNEPREDLMKEIGIRLEGGGGKGWSGDLVCCTLPSRGDGFYRHQCPSDGTTGRTDRGEQRNEKPVGNVQNGAASQGAAPTGALLVVRSLRAAPAEALLVVLSFRTASFRCDVAVLIWSLLIFFIFSCYWALA